jgi:ubiquinone/menaquinone biosynthesis C-methylase UbiE/tRNA A-37 threonylcarbamoyl transferase component Bud32
MASEERVPDIAGAILDGRSIDWGSAESSADGTGRLLVEQLKLVAAVAEFHRQLPALDAIDVSPPATARDPTPDLWGHLRVLERIGGGAFGEVFRAWDTRLDREVALKLLSAESTENQATSTIDEGRLLARVRHPNVATIYGSERIGNRVGLWMELVNGRTLEQLLDAGKVFTSAEAIAIGVEVCRAMSAVHRAGLIHRDIKAQNVMVAEDQRVVLMDFGTGYEPKDSSPATLAGTPLYLAPELLRGHGATVQSDIYSAGVLLYHILTHSYPVEAASLSELRERHQRQEPRLMRAARSDLPSKLAAVVDRAIDPQSERRYQSADDFARALEAVEGRRRIARLGYPAAVAAALIWVSWVAFQMLEQRRVNPYLMDTGASSVTPHVVPLTTQFGSPDEAQKVGEVLAALQAEPGKRIADVGAGEGSYTRRIARAVGPIGRVTAVDISEDNLANLRARVQQDNITNVDFVLCTLDDTRLVENTFDAVLIYNAYHHMTAPEPVLRSILAALKPGGRLVMSEPIHEEIHGENVRKATRAEQINDHEIAPDFVQQELEAAGFEVIEQRPDFLPFTSAGYKGGFWLMVARKPPAR